MADRAKSAVLRVAPGAQPSIGRRPPSFSAQDKARADLVRVFAGLFGADATATDIVEALARHGKADAHDADPIRAAVEAAGLRAHVEQPGKLVSGLWPALALMSNGQLVLVLSQEGGKLTLFEATASSRSS